jgi:hypothetical protein
VPQNCRIKKNQALPRVYFISTSLYQPFEGNWSVFAVSKAWLEPQSHYMKQFQLPSGFWPLKKPILPDALYGNQILFQGICTIWPACVYFRPPTMPSNLHKYYKYCSLVNKTIFMQTQGKQTPESYLSEHYWCKLSQIHWKCYNSYTGTIPIAK